MKYQTQQLNTCSTLKQGVKYVQNNNEDSSAVTSFCSRVDADP